jgi:predicted SnoaL-like aldol condensation-catalyzing enzyme
MDYKAKAKAYHTAVSEYDQATVIRMVREDYIQHNPKMPTGRAPFVEFLSTLKVHETKIVNIRMLNDGPYVIMHHLWKNAAPFGGKEMAAFHVIRFDADGMIAEHWNVMAAMADLNPSGRSLLDGETAIVDIQKTVENKAMVSRLFGEWIKARPELLSDAMSDFFMPTFRQHNATGADGIEGFKAIASDLIIDYKRQHRVFGEGNFVLSIAEGTLGRKPTAFYDLFRIEDNIIAEHWSIYQEIPTRGQANDNTMFNF